MGIRYRIEDLKALRESPLVAKPVNLPPIEEWMGYGHLYGLTSICS